MKEKIERNNEIIRMALRKKPKLGYKKIAKIFGLHYTTVGNIIKRQEERVGKGLDKG